MFQQNQRIAEYVLDERVGQSAYAESWRAHHHAWSDQEVIVKLPTDTAYLNNLRKEGIRAHRLVHPSIILPIGFDPMAQPPYLVTEYFAGQSLRDLITNKRLTVRQSVNILRHVLEALLHGHERGVIHGDIKPENILLDPVAAGRDFAAGGSVKVTDFGVGLAATATITRDTARAQQGNSLAYIAPEQRDGAAPDVKSDIYAVGVVLFEMLTGERPSGTELPSELNPKSPPALDDLFRKSYARRERRFDSARSFLDALASATSPAPAAPPAPRPAAPKDEAIGLANEDDPAPAPLPPAEPVEAAVEGGGIGFKDDDELPAPPPQDEEVAADSEPAEGIPFQSDQDAQPQPEGETLHADEENVGADTAGLEEAEVSYEPVIPEIPRVPSRADREAMFDELNKRQIRTPDDLRGALKGFVEARDLDAAETSNIRLRLVKWANSLAGGKTDLDEQIVLLGAGARPLYSIKFIMRTTRGDEPPRSQALEHPIAGQANLSLRSADYRLIAHFSAEMLNEKLLESIAGNPLRIAVTHLAREARREFFGRIQREDLLIFRANVITASYKFDEHKYRAFMVGSALSVVSAGEPFTKIRHEPTKRAATLLNGEQIQQGIKELRRGLDDPQWEGKSMVILGALRGKLAAAYMAEAKQQFKSFGWLESLDYSAKAGQLAPGNDAALDHANRVRKRVGQMQFFPGFLVALVFLGFALTWALQVRPLDLKTMVQTAGVLPFFVAGVAAFIAAVWSSQVLRVKMARTDFAFYQAAVFPTAIAGILAFAKFDNLRENLKEDVICAVLLLIVIVGDILLFKKLRRHLMRVVDDTNLAGDGLTVLNRIQGLLADEWERLKPHYLELGPLINFTSGQSSGAMPDLFEHSQAAPPPPKSKPEPEFEPVEEPEPSRSSGENPELDKLVQQMNSRIAANLRALAPAARMLVSVVNEYSKSVANRQIGMMQGNATKIEQKGKDLTAKVTDFERLCRTPLTLNAGDSPEVRAASAEIAEHLNDPDFKLLKSIAERARTFNQDQTSAIVDLMAMTPEVEEAIERLKR